MPWIGVDFDGTLSVYRGWEGKGVFGPPVPKMLERVNNWLADGFTVKIVTARASDPREVEGLKEWCKEHVGQELEITDRKDFDMVELWDDRAVQVEPNTGEVIARPRDLNKPSRKAQRWDYPLPPGRT